MASLTLSRACKGAPCARRMALSAFRISTSAAMAFPRTKPRTKPEMDPSLFPPGFTDNMDNMEQEQELLNWLWEKWTREQTNGNQTGASAQDDSSEDVQVNGERAALKLHPRVTINDTSPPDEDVGKMEFVEQLATLAKNDPSDALRFLEAVARDNGAQEEDIKTIAPEIIEHLNILRQMEDEQSEIVQRVRSRNRFRSSKPRPEKPLQKPWPGPWRQGTSG